MLTTTVGLNDDRFLLGWGEADRLTEPLLAFVRFVAINIGVIEVVDARLASRADQRADVLVIEHGNPHQPEDDVGGVVSCLRSAGR